MRVIDKHGEVLAWLLQSSNPSVRYLTLRELLAQPEEHAKVQQARRAIMQQGTVPAILALQHPEGWWGRLNVTYKPLMYRSTVWQLMFLAELRADPSDPSVRRGCEFVLRTMQSDQGDFPPRGRQYHKTDPADMLCYDAMTTWALLKLGYAEDARLARALGFIVRTIQESSFKCHFNANLACAWGAVKALRALAEIPESRRSQSMGSAIQSGVNFLLEGDLAQARFPTKPNGKVSRQWFRFGFPRSYQSDILQALGALTKLGVGGDPRLRPALVFLQEKRNADGTWPLQETPKLMWVPIEHRGKPSKWITLKALQVFQRAGMSIA
ncbi:MAG: hypothetical protein PVF70_10815 [Anaerolineales bacterium]|jgi:hypothetical protein